MAIDPASLASPQLSAQEPAPSSPPGPGPDEHSGPGLWGEDGFDFWDLLDIINPLQHIPVISTLYRAITGDTIAPGPRVLGGALFGGPLGLIASVADGMIEQVTGKDVGEHVIALLEGDEAPTQADTPAVALAAAEPAGPPAGAASHSRPAATDPAPLGLPVAVKAPPRPPLSAHEAALLLASVGIGGKMPAHESATTPPTRGALPPLPSNLDGVGLWLEQERSADTRRAEGTGQGGKDSAFAAAMARGLEKYAAFKGAARAPGGHFDGRF